MFTSVLISIFKLSSRLDIFSKSFSSVVADSIFVLASAISFSYASTRWLSQASFSEVATIFFAFASSCSAASSFFIALVFAFILCVPVLSVLEIVPPSTLPDSS